MSSLLFVSLHCPVGAVSWSLYIEGLLMKIYANLIVRHKNFKSPVEMPACSNLIHV